MKHILLTVLTALAFCSYAQDDPLTSNQKDLFDLSLEELLEVDVVDRNFYLYGYINSNLQKTFSYPYRAGDLVLQKDDPLEWTPVKNFHIYSQGNLSPRVSFLFNLARNGETLEIRNAWGNFVVIPEALQVRVGRMYRKFGLYNERLDQVPTFIGIEPPEMFDTDHLFLERTTNFMIHGSWENSSHKISYAVMTDNGENGPAPNVVPLGWDLRFKSFLNSFIVGTSGYMSSITDGRVSSTVALGSGSPRGGVLPWMAGDHFTVVGFFLEKQIGRLLIQSEYYTARHDALRDPESVLTVVTNAGINEKQRARFLGSNAAKDDAALVPEDVVQPVTFNVQTWYIRLGYDIQTRTGQFVPYLFLDWMRNPEVIQNKKYGGDEESGLADDGKFLKPSIGVVYRPIPSVAVKMDGSYHTQLFNGKTITYPELRLDFSFAFSNSSLEKALGK